jgi:hypothetical protein
VISFLGAFFNYGTRGAATDKAGQNTMEWLTGDNIWNEVVFDARLFQVWWHGGSEPVPWTPTHLWVWTPPKDAPQWKTIDLRELAEPHSVLFYNWNKPRDISVEKFFRFYAFSLIAGLLLLVGTVWVSVARAPNHTAMKIPWRGAVAGAAALGIVIAAGAWISHPKNPKLVVDKTEVLPGQAFNLKVAEMAGQKVVVRYSIDNRPPEEMTVALDANGSIHFEVSDVTRKGFYRMLDFRRQDDVFWVHSDAAITVK